MGTIGWSFYTNEGVLKQGVSGGSLTDADTLDGLDSSAFILKAGDTMSGALTLSGAPTLTDHAANKAYVDQRLALSGGTMTGDLLMSALADIELSDLSEIRWSDITLLRSSPGELQLSVGGNLSVQQDPSSADHLARKAYVDTFLPLSGGILLGDITLDPAVDIIFDNSSSLKWSDVTLSRSDISTLSLGVGEQIQVQQDPVSLNDLARKSYVDSVASGGISSLSDLSDVGPLSPADQMVLIYDGLIDNLWKSVNPPWLDRSGGTMTGSIKQPVRIITSSDSAVLSTDYTIFVNTPALGPDVSVELPTPAPADAGTTIVIKDVAGNAATWNISITTNGSESIDGQNDTIISTNYGSCTLITDGSDWFIV